MRGLRYSLITDFEIRDVEPSGYICHEIDNKFSILWKRMRGCLVNTSTRKVELCFSDTWWGVGGGGGLVPLHA